MKAEVTGYGARASVVVTFNVNDAHDFGRWVNQSARYPDRVADDGIAIQRAAHEAWNGECRDPDYCIVPRPVPEPK
jgi:hypothetical protein